MSGARRDIRQGDVAIQRGWPGYSKASPQLRVEHFSKKFAVLEMLVRNDLIHGADGTPGQTELLPTMPGLFQRDAGDEGLERRGNVGDVGLNRGDALVFLVQEVLG